MKKFINNKKFIVIPSLCAFELSSNKLVQLIQVVNAYFLINMNNGLDLTLNACHQLVENATTNEDFYMGYGFEIVNTEQASVLNKNLLKLDLNEIKLQTYADLTFESKYFLSVIDGRLNYTNQFYSWLDKQIFNILINNIDSDDKVLRRLADVYRDQKQNYISQNYFEEIVDLLKNEKTTLIATFH